ncbi:MAG: DUF3696 domain-containing protein [Treponema sp.]|jgi:predicted ATPase|nr:DUF3696 domain-containing protein [Treponema sp.]
MIKKWGVKNFKSILDQDLELAPLTIFAGTNSSGKSSFLQSILVTAQSLADKVDPGINLNGTLTKLGLFHDVYSKTNKKENIPFGDRKISICYEIVAPPKSLTSVSGNFSFSSGWSRKAERQFLEKDFKKMSDDEYIDLIIEHSERMQEMLRGTILDTSEFSCAYENTDKKALFKYNRNGLDEKSGENFIFDEESEKEWMDRLTGKEFDYIRILLNKFLLESSPVECWFKEDNWHNGLKCDDVIYLPSKILAATKFIADYFKSSIRYLGPLREDPKPFYTYKHYENNTDVGVKGEHTASVLYHYNAFERDYPSPFTPDERRQQVRSGWLSFAVGEWVEYIGVAADVEYSQSKTIGREEMIPLRVKMNDDEDYRDLTHVGVGVSQVLPIIVACLAMPEDSTIVIEQPELHLHPKMQSRLADFFIAMARSGRQCLIETHSEHIVNRLRYHYASAIDETILKDKAKIFFVEKNRKTGVSAFFDIEINKYGALSEWPDDFFDESQISTDKLFRAVMEKLEREEKDD